MNKIDIQCHLSIWLLSKYVITFVERPYTATTYKHADTLETSVEINK
jgi:hypothetical protein